MGTHLLKSIFLISLVCLTSIVTYAHDFEVDGIYYNITDPANFEVQVTYKGLSYSDYDNEYSDKVVIPVIVTNGGTTYAVTSIGNYAFEDCSGLTSVTIPNSVTSIGNSAFAYCSGLTSVTIPNSVTSIGYGVFSYCRGLTSITIPDSVTSIENYTFENCSSLTSVTIPNSVTSIGVEAFAYCSGLTSVTIGNSVTSIGEGAFYGCSGLTSVTIPNSVTSIGVCVLSDCSALTSIVVETGNTKYDSRENCNAIIDSETNELIVGCKNTIIPNSVTSIGNSAFWDCNGLTSVIIPNSVTSIGESAFWGCSGLKSVTIPNSVTSIGDEAFEYCYGLTSVTIPNSVTSIGESVFKFCRGLTSVTIGNSVTTAQNNQLVNYKEYRRYMDENDKLRQYIQEIAGEKDNLSEALYGLLDILISPNLRERIFTIADTLMGGRLIPISFGGGGDTSDLRWDRRNPEEDDQSYKRRCIMAAVGIVVRRNQPRKIRR